MKKIHFYLIAIAFVACCFLVMCWHALFSPVVTTDKGYSYYVRPGTSKHVVIAELTQQGVFKHPILLSFYFYSTQNAGLKRGEYYFPNGSTPYSIWKQITTGTGLLYHPFTIIPGWTFKQLRAAMAQAPGLQHLTASMDNQQIMERLGTADVSPEGEFSPDTYYYTRDDLDLVVLKRAYDLMQNHLKHAWQNRAAGLPYQTPYEALIAASMIEKEGYLDSDRPLIAGVLINRLRKEMLLQIDATVIYGLGDRYDGKIHKANLQEDTPYNTYLHKGLPPTPIAMPGLVSLEAALHPKLSDYYYYVAKGDGSHQFSTTLQAHHEAVQAAKDKPADNSSTTPASPAAAPILNH